MDHRISKVRKRNGESCDKLSVKKRNGKGKHNMLPIIKDHLAKKENQNLIELTGC